MTEPLFLLDGHIVERLSIEDAAALQELHVRCRAFYLLVEGGATRPSSAEEDLLAVPPGKDLEDKFYLGIYSLDRQLIGALDLVRNYPNVAEWWIGLLLLDPIVRGAGLGTRVYRAAREWIRQQGGRTIYLAVLEQNPAAERFWRRQGFEEHRRATFTAPTGLISQTTVLSQNI